MSGNDSATAERSSALSIPPGLSWGAVGILAFSLTVPLTRVAVQELDPAFVGAGRAMVAGVLAGLCLVLTRQRLPRRHEVLRLGVVALGVVVGFPLCTSAALTEVPASHAAVVIGLLPAATAAMSVLRTRQRVPGRFWFWAVAGAVTVVGFIAHANGGLGRPSAADAWLVAAVLLAAVGYAEGGLLARTLGAWQTICWALVLALPLMTLLTAQTPVRALTQASAPAWISFGYLSLVSMFLGFFAWYRGLAIGPMAQVSQVQLVQPVLSLGWAALLLGEHLSASLAVPAVLVIACAACAIRARLPGPAARHGGNGLRGAGTGRSTRPHRRRR